VLRMVDEKMMRGGLRQITWLKSLFDTLHPLPIGSKSITELRSIVRITAFDCVSEKTNKSSTEERVITQILLRSRDVSTIRK
jgi:hypothetical protein